MGVLPRDVIPTIGKGGKYGCMADVEYPPSQHYREKITETRKKWLDFASWQDYVPKRSHRL